MLDKQQQRLIKESLIAINRQRPDTLDYPVYFLPAGQNSPEELGEIVCGLQDLPEIPWPDENCIILAEDYANRLLELDIYTINGFIHSANNKTRCIDYPKPKNLGAVEHIEAITTGLNLKTGRITSVKKSFTMLHMLDITPHSEKSIKISAARQIQRLDEYAEQGALLFTDKQLSPKSKQQYQRYMIAAAARGETCWTAFCKGDKHEYQPGLASDVLCCLANIACPCHYVVKSNFIKGFGPTGTMRRAMQFKSIFTVINYERLYRIAGEKTQGEIQPHERRGHVRYHWRLGTPPMDYRNVPHNTLIRLKLARINRVPRTYIPPTWVGERMFTSGQASHEILTEMPMKTLGKKS